MEEQKVNLNNNGIERFQLFYTEAIMQDSSFPQINKIKPVFEKITLDEFIELVERIFKEEDYELTQQFLYFLILFRDMKHLQDYINSERFTLQMLERFIIFTFGYCTIHDHSTERVLDEILFFLNDERLLDLALNSAYINHDKLILFLILSKFDINMLNRYFLKIKNTTDFIEHFVKLPDEVMKSIISRNYHLFQYIMIMMAEVETTQKVSAEFMNRYHEDIKQFSRLSDILRKYRENNNLDKEKDLPFYKRDMSRLSFLVNMVRELPDPVRAVDYFNGERVFIDEMEKNVVLAVVTDPLLKNIFRNYNVMPE
ncbi:MAG TPA: hypothetical protein P5120_12160 [Spirochaetota bacterium]|nr:hypothetical protein [Spirochaetota bacterium]HPJ41691.1 hypothetical protein [Spirochaetota bacterium]HPR37441.1 hypothetical protein [Spirochaetota bacterium]HRX48265.1 hypothetical protein [Spirochaetota bacterium]